MQNNSNKNWENKGWEAMQQMLDKDLPVEEKQPKRKIIPWFWAAGFALMIGVGGALFLTSDSTSNSTTESPETATTVPSNFESNSIVENAASVVDNSLIETRNTANSEKNDDLSTLADKSEGKIKNSGKKSQSIDNQFFIKEKNLRSSPKIANITESDSGNLNNVENIEKNVDKSKKEKIDSLIASNIHFDLKTSGYSKHEIELVEMLPFRGLELDVYFAQNLDAPEPIFAKAKKIKRATGKAKPSVRLIAGATVHLDPKVNGFETGLLVDLPIKDSKWSLETGLNYRFSKQKTLRLNWGTQRSNNSLDDQLFELDTNGLPNSSNNVYYYQSSEQLSALTSKKFHLISVPLNIRYGFHSKWSVALGLNSLVHLNAFLEDLSVENLGLTAFVSSEPLKKYDLAANASVDFQATDRWSFHLKYNHGNLLQGDSWQVDNRYFNAGAGFTF